MSSWLMIGALLLISTTSFTAAPGLQLGAKGCTDDFIQRNNYCYRFFDIRKAFQPARLHCRKYSAHLVTIYSEYEQKFLYNLSGGVAHWIGLNDAEGPSEHHVEGVFKWDNDFKPISYENWQEGEPNNKNHLDCVASNNLGWFMMVSGCASAKLPYICKKIMDDCSHWTSDSFSNTKKWMTIILLIILIVLLLVCVVWYNGRDVIK